MIGFLFGEATLAAGRGLVHAPLQHSALIELAVYCLPGSSFRARSVIGGDGEHPGISCNSTAHRPSICPAFVARPSVVRRIMVQEDRTCMNCVIGGYFARQNFTPARCEDRGYGGIDRHASLCPIKYIATNTSVPKPRTNWVGM